MLVNILLVLLFILILYCFVKNHILEEVGSYVFMSKEATGTIRGVAILAIAFAHICQAEPVLKEILIGGKFSYLIVFSWGGLGVAVFFLLSGYGCSLSISKSNNDLKWLVRHMAKMLMYFVISFIFVVIVRKNILGEAIDFSECMKNFVMLRLPGTSSWYFKVQLLFYLLLVISDKIKRNQCFIVSMLVLTYAVMAKIGGLPDYWWKTSMCFAAGCIFARYREILSIQVHNIWVKITVLILGLSAFVYTLIDSHYIFILQLFAFVCVAGCIVLFWDLFVGKNYIFERIGKSSLALYLIHIGIIDTVYALPYDTNVKTLVFIGLVVFGTLIGYKVSEKCNVLLKI